MQLTVPYSPDVFVEDPTGKDQVPGSDACLSGPELCVEEKATYGLEVGEIETALNCPALTTVVPEGNKTYNTAPGSTTSPSCVDVKAAVDVTQKANEHNARGYLTTNLLRTKSYIGEVQQSMKDAAYVRLSQLRHLIAPLDARGYLTTDLLRTKSYIDEVQRSMKDAACVRLSQLRQLEAPLGPFVYELYITMRRSAARASTLKRFGFGMLFLLGAIALANLSCTPLRTASGEVPVVSASGSRRVPIEVLVQHADFAGYLNAHALPFEKLLDHTLGGSAAAMDMVKAELDARKFGARVKYSDLKGKQEMTGTLEEIEELARSVGEDLTDFEGDVQAALDSITANTRRASRSIAHAKAKDSWYSHKSRDTVLFEFENAMHVSEDVFKELTKNAHTTRAHLVRLDQRLKVFVGMLESENADFARQHRKLSASLRTWFGGNKLALAENADGRHLLQSLETHHDHAVVRVKGVLGALAELRANMDRLHKKVLETPGPRQYDMVKPEDYISELEKGIERLQRSRGRYVGGGASRRRAALGAK